MSLRFECLFVLRFVIRQCLCTPAVGSLHASSRSILVVITAGAPNSLPGESIKKRILSGLCASSTNVTIRSMLRRSAARLIARTDGSWAEVRHRFYYRYRCVATAQMGGKGGALLRNYTPGPDGLFRLIESSYLISRIDRRERARWDGSGIKVVGEQAPVTPMGFLQTPSLSPFRGIIPGPSISTLDIN